MADAERQADSRQVSEMRAEVEHLKQPVAAADRFAHPPCRVNKLWKATSPSSRSGLGLVLPVSRAGRLLPAHSGPETHPYNGGHGRAGNARAGSATCQACSSAGSSSPRLLTDNGPRHVSGELRRRLEGRQTEDTRNPPYHAMTQGKVARYPRSMKNPVRPQTFQYPWDLEQKIGRFADNFSRRRYDEPLGNVTLAGVYIGRARRSSHTGRRLHAERSRRGAVRTPRFRGLPPDPRYVRDDLPSRRGVSWPGARFVPLSLTRYSCSGWLCNIQAHCPNGVANRLRSLGSSAAWAACRRLGRRAMACWKVCILRCS